MTQVSGGISTGHVDVFSYAAHAIPWGLAGDLKYGVLDSYICATAVDRRPKRFQSRNVVDWTADGRGNFYVAAVCLLLPEFRALERRRPDE